ncbi:MAG: alcohol dehydrogenase catalytic domain-containing protein [Acidimicrobiia bacterium]|nr:alcohol dehydrogenase catalytic domain-containing protein [Acidimicrobiia bacterium]
MPTTQLRARVTVFDGGEVWLKEIDLPTRGTGEIDVAIEAGAVCGSDLHTVLGHRSAPPEVALGHEGVGRVVDIDEGATDQRGRPLSAGDRVVFALFSACGTCDRCRDGLEMKCRTLFKYGHESIEKAPHASGTLASHVRLLPGVPVLTIPDGLTAAQVVSAGCSVATAAAMVRTLGDRADGRTLVFGAGAVGAYCAAILATLGSEVYVSDPSPTRLAVAEKLGARAYTGSEEPFPAVLEASGNANAFVNALETADIGGMVVAAGSVSPGSTTVTFDPSLAVTRRLTLVGIHNYSADDFVWAVDWLGEHAASLELEQLLSPPQPLDDIESAFDLMETGEHLRVLVVPNDTRG